MGRMEQTIREAWVWMEPDGGTASEERWTTRE